MVDAVTPPPGARTPMNQPATPRFDIFSPGVGLVAIGFGLLSLAAVEAVTALRNGEERVAIAPPLPAFGSFMPVEAAGADADALQDAVGVGPGSPRRGGAPSGTLVGLAAAPMPNGLALFRLYGSGAVEAMITTEDNTWGPWVPVAPGKSTDMRRLPADAGSGNPDTENP